MEALKVSKRIDHQNDDLDRGEQGMKEDITGIERQMKEGFAAVNGRLDKVDERLDKVDQRLDKVDERLDKVDQRLDKVDQRFERVAERFERVAERFEKTPTREEMNEGFAAVNGRLDKTQHLIWGFGGTLVVGLIGCVITLIATHPA